MPYAAVIAGGEVLYETTDGNEGPIAAGVDTDGLNIAVYDKVLGEMFEMSLLDVTQEMQIIRK